MPYPAFVTTARVQNVWIVAISAPALGVTGRGPTACVAVGLDCAAIIERATPRARSKVKCNTPVYKTSKV